ncbi:hypothetical protein IFM89_015088 [Coptis chinensis]|uniref:Uncharacterized protein n=1 Tax=Coptis chinensis TaxID=261450 RepID=A0A835IC28_9MAGN|nr:hypothetical protein IFM89_015088 [Coptis chinensis]
MDYDSSMSFCFFACKHGLHGLRQEASQGGHDAQQARLEEQHQLEFPMSWGVPSWWLIHGLARDIQIQRSGLSATLTPRIDPRTLLINWLKLGTNSDQKIDITDSCSQMMLQLHDVYDPNNINIKIKIISGTPCGAVVVEAKRAQSN